MLVGRRISIGPLIPADFPSLFCWANDVDAARFDIAYRPVDFVTHSQWCENLGKDPAVVVFAIRTLDEPTIIGYVRIGNISSVHRSAEFGIRIGAEENRGKGYGKEATNLALDFCWRHLNLKRVQLIVFAHNARAERAYTAAGFMREGLLREAAFIDGAWIDVALMAAFRPVAAQVRRAEETALASAA